MHIKTKNDIETFTICRGYWVNKHSRLLLKLAQFSPIFLGISIISIGFIFPLTQLLLQQPYRDELLDDTLDYGKILCYFCYNCYQIDLILSAQFL